MIIENKQHEYFFMVQNDYIDKWLRVIGPGPFTLLCVFKKFCKSDSEKVFPQIKREDWAEYMGVSLQTLNSYLKVLKKYNLIQIISPKGADRLMHRPHRYIINTPDEGVLKEADYPTPLSEECKFIDQIHTPSKNIFKETISSDNINFIVSGDNKNSGAQDNNTVIYKTVDNLKTFSRQRIFKKEKKSSPVKSKEGEEQNKTYIRLARRLRRIVESANRITSATKTNQWPDQFRKLHNVDKIPLLQINKVLDWYEEHIGQQYVPECFCATSFRSKFPKLELSITRSEKQKPTSDWRSKRKYLNPPGTYGRNVTVIEID
jgi:hypothetical protein